MRPIGGVVSTFSKILGVVILLSVAGCKKDEPEPAGRQAAARPTGKAPIISPVNFDSGSTAIAPDEAAAIDEAAQILRTTEWDVIVVGLADASGDAAMNKQLSEERAEAVAAALRAKVPKMKPERILVHAIGERLATGATQSERKVEFVFYFDEGLPVRQVVLNSRVLEEDFRAREESRETAPQPYAPK
jgi:OmpA-OmpF porin, OOP family